MGTTGTPKAQPEEKKEKLPPAPAVTEVVPVPIRKEMAKKDQGGDAEGAQPKATTPVARKPEKHGESGRHSTAAFIKGEHKPAQKKVIGLIKSGGGSSSTGEKKPEKKEQAK